MRPKHKKLSQIFAAVAVGGAIVAGLAGCGNQADIASQNLSTAADNFRILRQIDFIDTITGQDIVSVRGLCSLGNNDVYPEISVTCKTGTDAHGNDVYIKDFFEVTPTTTVATVQLSPAEVSSAQYSVTWNPGALVPAFNGPGGAPLTPPPATPSASATAPAGSSKSQPTKVVVVTVPAQATPTP